MNIGEILKQAREMRRLSQTQLARKLHVTKQTISNYETGQRSPDIETLDALCRVLDVTITFPLTDSSGTTHP